MALGAVENIGRLPELRRKLLWTFAILGAFRIGVHIPVPGVDPQALAAFFDSVSNSLVGLFNMFSGGGLERFSIFALGIMPYISASIIMQLLQVVSPELKRLAKEEGAAGRKKITQYTRYGTVLITMIQGFALAVGLETMPAAAGIVGVVIEPGWTFRIITVITLVAGTILIMWLGEQITEKGIGNGISLIIFAGIVAAIPGATSRYFTTAAAEGTNIIIVIGLILFMVAVLCAIVFVERGQRRIPIHYAKRLMGRRMVGGQNTHLPLRLNTAGVIPPIFASSLLLFPSTLTMFSASFPWLNDVAALFSAYDTVLYNVFFVGLIIFFCFFYTAIVFDPKDIAENLKNQGGFIPGIRPGGKTRDYINAVLTRLTLWGSLYISAVCVLPAILSSLFGPTITFGGTSLLIMVGVAMDFMGRIESYLISRQYEGLMQKGKVKGRA
ncbi:MAG: preprotein translocase subunit SecY [Desulfovibrionaceae bacterium]|nr:preprotein translocase subunit SecY [Desulfovibrionaceae bacterium]